MPQTRPPLRSALALALVACSALTATAAAQQLASAGSSRPAVGMTAPIDLDHQIRDRLGVTAYSIQTFAAPADSAQGFAATFDLGGRTFTADFAPDPVNTPDCTMLLDDGSGSPKIIAAPPSCTYRGTIRGVPGSICSGSLIGGRLTAVVLMGPTGGSYSVLPLSEVLPGAPASMHIVSSNDDLVAGPWRCGVDSDRFGPPLVAGHGTGGPDSSLICELAVEADYPFYQLIGSASGVAQDISTVIANVTSYYILSGTSVRFRIVRYIIRTTPQANPYTYNTTDAQTLLAAFRTLWNNLCGDIPRDTAHLFTGKELNGTTIGLAYLNSVCVTQWAYGISQSRFSLQPGRRAALTSHEIGHNFSAHHCDDAASLCSPCQLMSAVQGSTTAQLTRFGCSTAPILSFASSRPCLSPGPLRMPPPNCPADLNVDGALSGLDFGAFQAAFAAADPRADLNGDGRFTVADYIAFMNAYAAGCP